MMNETSIFTHFLDVPDVHCFLISRSLSVGELIESERQEPEPEQPGQRSIAEGG